MKLQDLLVEDQNAYPLETRETQQQQLHEVVELHDLMIEEKKNHHQTRRLILQKEVMKLKGELEEEEAMNKALRAIHRGPILSQPRLSLLLLPPQVQEIIEELANVEAEILCLEKRIEELKLEVFNERIETKVQEIKILLTHQQKEQEQMMNHKMLGQQDQTTTSSESTIKDESNQRLTSESHEGDTKEGGEKINLIRTASISSDAELFRMSPSGGFADEIDELSRMHRSRMRNKHLLFGESEKENPNSISQQLIECLKGILLELSQVSREREGTSTVSKLSLSHLKNASFKRKSALSLYDHKASNLDPYGVATNGSVRDIGTYKNFTHITRSSIDVTRLADCSTAAVKLRVLIEKLSQIELSCLSHKQKLAFWINIYNACILNAFLKYGLPSSQEKFETLIDKASLNVGGMVLNALAIERYILRRTCERDESVSRNEKDTQIHKSYRLGFSEPNLTFTLCCGSWSSPALRIYTAEEVVDDLIRARVEYLEASIGVSSEKKILIPQLLYRHIEEFAEDVESLLEWVCTQLPPRCLSLKETIYECLRKKAEVPVMKMVEIQPYQYEFRYLLPLSA